MFEVVIEQMLSYCC